MNFEETKMIIEEIKQELNRAFGKYEFIEDGHYYLCNGNELELVQQGLYINIRKNLIVKQ